METCLICHPDFSGTLRRILSRNFREQIAAEHGNDFGIPDFQVLSVYFCKSTRPRAHRTDLTFDLNGTLRPVDLSVFFFDHPRILCSAYLRLFFRCHFAFFKFWKCLHQKFCSGCGELVKETAAGLICCKRNFHFRQHIACVEAFIHLHNGYAAHFIAVHDSPLDRRCSAVSRKQGCMNVDASVFRHVQNLFWNNLAECNDNDHIRLHFPDLFDRLCIPHAARLIDRKAVFFGCLFHRCRHHLFSAALRFVRLGHNACDLITGLHECLKCSHGEIRGSHKYHFHLKSSPLF